MKKITQLGLGNSVSAESSLNRAAPLVANPTTSPESKIIYRVFCSKKKIKRLKKLQKIVNFQKTSKKRKKKKKKKKKFSKIVKNNKTSK